MSDKVTEELKKIYARAYKQGIWLWECCPARGGTGYVAAAGSVKHIKGIEQKLGEKITVNELTLGDIVNYTDALPGLGSTREEACRNAIKEYKKYKRK